MTIIKDQLIEAQLEVIDNASLPSGRPVGSVYYNKTTEKIQTVKQDGNLRNVFYEDEINYPVVPPTAITQWMEDSNAVNFVVPSTNQYARYRRYVTIPGRTYTLNGGIDLYNTSGSSTFYSVQVVDSTAVGAGSSTNVTLAGSKLLHRFKLHEPNGNSGQHCPFNITYVATETYLNILVRTAAIGTFVVKGTFTNTGSSEKTSVTLIQHSNYEKVVSFT